MKIYKFLNNFLDKSIIFDQKFWKHIMGSLGD